MSRLASSRGMTLIEVMVVLMLLAALVGAGGYTIGRIASADLRKDAMKMVAAMKHSHNRAAVNNSRYRMVFDFDKNEYYTEVADSAVVDDVELDADDEGLLPEEARELEEQRQAAQDTSDGKAPDPFGLNRKVSYSRVQDGSIKPKTLSGGVRFERIMTRHQKIPFTKGRATVSFFPDGSMEPAMITLGDGKASYTLVTEQLTGRVLVYSDEEAIDESTFGEVERDE